MLGNNPQCVDKGGYILGSDAHMAVRRPPEPASLPAAIGYMIALQSHPAAQVSRLGIDVTYAFICWPINAQRSCHKKLYSVFSWVGGE